MNNTLEDVSKYSKRLMVREPFYGLFLISLNKELTETKTQTACVSKNRINNQLSINPTFWDKLDEKTKIAILKHELLHIGFFHLSAFTAYEDKELFNIAADLEINQYIEPDLKGKSWMGLELSTFKELKLPVKAGSKVYYELLKKDVNTGKSKNLDDIYNRMKAGQQVVCSHEAWKEFEGMSEAEQRLIKKQINHQLKELAEQLKKTRGTIPAEFEDYISSLFELSEPVIDWKAYLRRFAGLSTKIFTKKTRHKQSKRFVENPGLKIKQKKHILVARDTSGSVLDIDLLEFNNEIHHIYKTGTSITVIDCDATTYTPFEYNGHIEQLSRVNGRGGTSFQPVIDYLELNKSKYNLLIYLTDLECSPPTKPCKPTLWVVCSNRTIYNNFPGQIVKISR